MKFKDAQLQECYNRNFVETSGFSDDLRQVGAVLAVHDFFQMLEGPHSERVHETVQVLTSAELRPALREWYERCRTGISAAETAFRDHLNELTGERFGIGLDTISNPS